MAFQKPELLSGTVDGVNDTFFTSAPYQAGSLSAYFNGQLLNPDDFIETYPDTGEVTMVFPYIPEPGEEVTAFYFDQNAEQVLDCLDVIIQEEVYSVVLVC